ncbi:MAG: hypothetical protein KJ737_00125 [Proteobacteria bacterium]|nr:hypothetical protein [Pseudomonadota bacterium]
MAVKKQLSPEYKEFHVRFLTLIDLKGKKFWMENLGAQANLIWGWHQGNVPSMDYVLKVCELSGASANWLFLGHGPKFLDDEEPASFQKTGHSLMDAERETLQEELYLNDRKLKFEKKAALKEIETIKKDAEIARLLKWLKDIFGPDIQTSDDIKPIEIVAKIVAPILTFFKTHGDIMIPMIESYATSKDAENLLNQITRFISKVKKESPK